jgi:hypothetical protein
MSAKVMKEHAYGQVKVLESCVNNKALIRFPAQVLSVEEAEGFMCHLITGIEKARKINKDPI